MAALGYGGMVATPAVFHFFHSHYEKLGPQDLIVVGFGLMMGIGFYGAAIVAIWCLFSAVFSLLRSRHAKS
jgi:F0F1-type ATP synthase membrane subunit c/vacuolar-type H+-ATPase subunit K